MSDPFSDGYYNRGGVEFPLTSSTAVTLLEDTDKLTSSLLLYLKAVLEYELSARWIAELAKASFSIDSNPDGYVIADLVPFDPAVYLQESQFKFPILAAYKQKGAYHESSLEISAVRWTIGIDYVLPPMDVVLFRKLGPMLHAVEKVTRRAIEEGNHPAYNSGIQWGSTCDIDGAYCNDVSLGTWRVKASNVTQDQGLLFPVLSITATINERDRKSANSTVMIEGVDPEIDIEGT